MNRFRQGLVLQLFVLIILPLTLLLLIVTFWSYSIHQRDMRRLVGERDERAVQAASASISEHLLHRLSAIQSLSLRAGTVSPNDSSEILSSSDYLLADFEGGLGLVSTSGELLGYEGDSQLWNETTAIIQKRDSNQTSFILPGPPGSGLMLTGAVDPDENVVAAGLFSPEELAKRSLAGAFGNDQRTGILLTNAEGDILYNHGLAVETANPIEQSGVEAALSGESGTMDYKEDGSEYVVAYAPVPGFGWVLVVEEPWEEVMNPSSSASQMMPLVLAPVLVLAVVALWLGIEQVVKPLRKLESRAEAYSWGDHNALETPVGGIQEIRSLQAQLIDMSQKVHAAQRSLHGYIGEITAAQEEERRRLARELHDDTIQSLIALKQRVQMVMLMGNGAEGDMLQELEQMTEQTIENLRRVTRALRPIYLEDLGLVTALEMLAQESERGGSLSLEFQRTGEERRLPALVELSLYRIAQEAVSNVSRHSHATQAKIGIHFTPETVTLEVVDNGKGFVVPRAPSEFAPEGHFGLLGLYERADLIRARLDIQSQPDKGTRLMVEIPV
ncbi:MAG: HAMP domain-containing protein [Chloroflexi bacterium]|nr:MAG: HAMP domain-containing protein [Chloroflexota bacterium]